MYIVNTFHCKIKSSLKSEQSIVMADFKGLLSATYSLSLTLSLFLSIFPFPSFPLYFSLVPDSLSLFLSLILSYPLSLPPSLLSLSHIPPILHKLFFIFSVT